MLIILLENKSLDKNVKARNEQLLSDYPELISKFSLLTLAGLSISHALFRIAGDYAEALSKGGERRYVYDEIALTCQRLKNGIHEAIAYEEMGHRFAVPCYIKFCSLLISGLKRGTSDFNRLLSDEAEASLLEKKASILQKGERASSKLMGPMMLMFIIILILVMVPALLTINI